MNVVADLLARDRRGRDLALVTPDDRERTYRDLITNGYKAANTLRYLGARPGATVAVDPTPGFHTTLAFLGAAALGAPVRFDAVAGVDRGDPVVLADVATAVDLDPPPGTNLAAFGGSPDRPETTHWEQELWSENPGMPPSEAAPEDPVLRDVDRDYTHRTTCSIAAAAVDAVGIDADTRVVLRERFADPASVAVGVVAPLSAGGAAVLAPSGRGPDGSRGDVAVCAADVDAPEPRQVDPAAFVTDRR